MIYTVIQNFTQRSERNYLLLNNETDEQEVWGKRIIKRVFMPGQKLEITGDSADPKIKKL